MLADSSTGRAPPAAAVPRSHHGVVATRESARPAGDAARQAAESPIVERAGQAGFLARAVVVLLIAAIAADIAHGGSDRPADTSGALRTVAGSPAGLVLLVVLAVAFAGHAAWRFLEAATGLRHDQGRQRTLKRLGYVAIGAGYAGLCVLTVRVIAGRGGGSEDSHSKQAAADLLALPGGRAAVVALGAVVVVVAAGFAVWAIRGSFVRALHVERLGRWSRRAVLALGIAGQASRGVILGVAGFLLLDAGVQDDGSRAEGLDGTLRVIAGRPYGWALLVLTCVGLVVFSAFSVAQAFRVRTSEDDRGRRR